MAGGGNTIAVERAGCTACARQLSSRNTSGLCRACCGRILGARKRQHADKWCLVCSKPVSRFSKNSLCREHFLSERLRTPEMQARRNEGLARHAAANRPAMAAQLRSNVKQALERPEYLARVVERMKVIQPLAVIAGRTPEARAKRGLSHTETSLGWCPPERRDEYRRLMRNIGAAAARIAITKLIADARRPLTFEEQLARVMSGEVRVVEKQRVASPAYDFTLGGVSGGWA